MEEQPKNIRKKQVEKTPEIPVVISEPKLETNDEIAIALERYNGFARSLFGTDYELGKVKLKKGQKDPRKITMLKVWQEFNLEQEARGNSDATLKTYRKHFNQIFDFLGFNYLMQGKEVADDAINRKLGTAREIGAGMPVLVLSLDNIAAYYRKYLKGKKLSEQTIASALRHFRAIVYFTQEKGWIEKYEIKIKEPKPEPKKEFTDEELKKIGRKPRIVEDSIAEYRCYVMIKYLLATGNRISSALALDVGDIDFDKNTIRVVVQKNKEPKVMPLTHDIRNIISEWIYRCRTDEQTGMPLYEEPLFCNRTGGRLTYDGAKDAMKDYFVKRGVKWEGFHKFRYSYATHWIRDGGNPLLLKEQLGHSSLAMTNRYVLMTGAATRQEAEQHSLIKKVPEKTGRKALKVRPMK